VKSIAKLKAQFRDGEITKEEFIRRSLVLHQTLFDYVGVIGSTDVSEIKINAEGVSFLIGSEGIWLNCPPDEARVAPLEVMNFDHYEPAETAVMDLLAAGARNILDIGANIGWYATRFAVRLPQVRVWAFEPMPTSFAYLQRNIAINGVGLRVTTFNYGLSNTAGPVEFFISPKNGTNASLKNVSNANDAVPITGLTNTLDRWVANYRVVPDLIKCDVEGAEFLVFQGGIATLRDHRPVVITELLRKWAKPFGYHPNDMIRYFAELGYRCVAIGSGTARSITEVTDETPETNYAFLHGEAHSSRLTVLGIRE
jgi:FkbM family methyltransferase